MDIASSLGVSKGTVSMALNGNDRVARKTRESVHARARELGYVYNRAAASLATGVTGLVGLAVHNLTNPYFTQVCSAIEHELELSGKFALLCNLDESREKQTRFLQALREQNADGLIICPAIGTTVADLAVFNDIGPVVLFARDVPGSGYDYVGNDDHLAMTMATRHLFELGHRRLGFICGGNSTTVSIERRDGYLQAHREYGIEADPDLMVEVKLVPEGGDEGARKLMAKTRPPTGIVCLTDYMALGAVSALHSMGLKPGVDVAIIGCDGISEGERAYINLSTIDVQKQRLGQTAAQLLQSRLKYPDKAPQIIRIEPVARYRNSCGEAQQNTDQSNKVSET